MRQPTPISPARRLLFLRLFREAGMGLLVSVARSHADI